MNRHLLRITTAQEGEALIESMEAAGYTVAHMAATDKGGFGSVIQVVLHFQRSAPVVDQSEAADAEPIAEGRLTVKQERFVAEYLANGRNATRAAVAAGYSEARAEVTGSELLKNRKVAEALAGRL